MIKVASHLSKGFILSIVHGCSCCVHREEPMDEDSTCFDCSFERHYSSNSSDGDHQFDLSLAEEYPELFKAYNGEEFDLARADEERKKLKEANRR